MSTQKLIVSAVVYSPIALYMLKSIGGVLGGRKMVEWDTRRKMFDVESRCYRDMVETEEAKKKIASLNAKLKDAEATRRHNVGDVESLYIMAKNDLKKAQKEIRDLKAKIEDLREVGENDLDGG